MIFNSKLSIITVNLNNKDGLQNTINSIINQSFRDFEWIIIDGGSTDGSKALIESYQDYIDYWVSESDKGIYNGMNKGILNSHGEYLLFLNSGDFLYDNDVIKKIIPLLHDYDMFYGIEIINNKNFDTKFRGLLSDKEIIKIFAYSYFPHGSTFIKRHVFDFYGLYEEKLNYASDELFYYKTLILGNAKIVALPNIISVFEGNGVSVRKIKEYLAEFNEEINKYPRIKELIEFYKLNREILESIHYSKLTFNSFRIYYWFYRKFLKKKLF